ncbi:VOC family protein [Aurantimonas sp. VKM B-3413]|uniref:VOC family protein n=1 Tax=Aurantimonas sp. VKM B-3413 TaxID=2779401 RepID=UPI001E2A8BB1|nr:VOC family protein [Aurantimonas sp. VKM B-3413]MCB8837715.1 VOC family protein [Aurantimonas sp. VKM B-3413]
MAKTIHTMIRVLDEARSRDFYEKAFGLTLAGRYDFETFTLVYLSNPESEHEVELTVNKAQTEPYDLGNGYGHIAVSVGDLAAEHERMRQAGLSPKDIKELSHEGRHLARFFFIEDPDGYKIEVLERGGRFK